MIDTCARIDNHCGVIPQHRALEFDPILYPAQFWSHCVYHHVIALRRNLGSILKAEAKKVSVRNPSDAITLLDLPAKAHLPIDDSNEVFTKLVSWKGENKTFVCGLCE